MWLRLGGYATRSAVLVLLLAHSKLDLVRQESRESGSVSREIVGKLSGRTSKIVIRHRVRGH